MSNFFEGISRFKQQDYPKLKKLFKQLSHGQSPDVLFITCSDSRVVPNLFTQSKPGELFVIRNAGNLVPEFKQLSTESATIEYAVKALNVKHIIVCGHAKCGAVAGALYPEKVADLPQVAKVLQKEGPDFKKLKASHQGTADALYNKAIEQNVNFQLKKLKRYPYIHEKLKTGAIQLHGWVYDFENGEVFAHQPTLNSYTPLRPKTREEPKKIDWLFVIRCVGGA